MNRKLADRSYGYPPYGRGAYLYSEFAGVIVLYQCVGGFAGSCSLHLDFAADR